MMSLSPASSDLVEHISAHSGSLPSSSRLAPYLRYFDAAGDSLHAAGAISALVHLAARAEVADARVLRGARTGRRSVAAADAQILRVEHDLGGREDAADRTHRRARGVGAVHARHGDRAFARRAVVDGDDAASVDAPRHLVLVLQAVTQALHSMQRSASQRNFIRAMLPPPTPPRSGTAWPWVPACWSPGRSHRWSACSRLAEHVGLMPAGYLSRRSAPSNQPAKW